MQHDPKNSQIRLELTGVPTSGYSTEQLRDAAESLIAAVEDLLCLNSKLVHTQLGYRHCDEFDSGTLKRFLLLHLVPKPRLQADLFARGIDAEAMESVLRHDWQTVIEAFRRAPQTGDAARVRFAERIASAVMNLPADMLPPPLAPEMLAAIKSAKRRVGGQFFGARWQLSLNGVGFDWDNTPLHLNARINRRGEDGYWLRPLDTNGTRTCDRLAMAFPANLDVLARLDRATHTGKTEPIVVRVGRDVEDGTPVCADFLDFEFGPGAIDPGFTLR